MKIFGRLILIYSLVLSPLLPYQTRAQSSAGGVQSFSPLDIFSRPLDSRNLYLGPNKVVNEYRLLGFTHFPEITHHGFQTALKTSPLVLESSPQNLLQNTKYQELLQSEAGRQQLFRQYRGAFSSLSVATGENLSQQTKSLQRDLLKQVQAENNFQGHSVEVRSQMEQLEVNRRLLQQGFSEQQRLQALNRVLEAQKTLSNPRSRAQFHFANGLTEGRAAPGRASFIPRNMVHHLRGNITLRVPDPFGKDVDISWPRSAQGLEKMNAPEFMRSVKNGAIEAGRLEVVFLVIMYAIAEFKMLTDYESNPRAFEQTMHQSVSWAMHLSVASFFVGGWATKIGVDNLNVARHSLANLYNLEKQGKMFSKNPTLKQNYIKGNMSALASSGFLKKAMSYPGLTGGFLISQLVYGWADKLESCLKVEDLDSGRYTPQQQRRFEESCQRNFLEFAGQLAQSPETWMQLTGLLSAKALLTFGMNKAQMMRYGAAQNVQSQKALAQTNPRKFSYKVRIAARGVMAPLVTTVVGMVAFVLIFEILYASMEWSHRRLTLHVPTRRAHDDLVDLLQDYSSRGWDMEGLCDSRTLLEGELKDYLKPLMFWRDNESCGQELVQAFMANHQRANASWRQDLVAPIQTSIEQWSEFTFKATNLYKASRLLYGDVIEQIRLQKQSSTPLRLQRTYNPQTQAEEALGHVNSHLFSHPLPLFRSEPHFGWSSRLNPSETLETIAYPVYDGVSTNWQDRWTQQTGVELFEERMTRFLDQVVPSALEKLRTYARSTQDPNEQADAMEIVRHLQTSSSDAAGDLDEISYGLYLISRKVEDDQGALQCRALSKECFWVEFQKDFLDEELWSENKEGEMIFNKGRSGLAGYQTSRFKPYGVKPLGPGQGFFIRYNQRLQNNKIETSYYNPDYQSLTDFILKNMVCGENANKVESKSWLPDFIADSRLMRPRLSPELQLVRIPLNPNSDICFEDSSQNRWRRGVMPGAPGFYNYIEEKNNPEISYGGIVDYLYQQTSDEILNDFDGWWERVMEPRYEKVIGNLYNDLFIEKKIGEDFENLLSLENSDNNCVESCQDFEYEHKKGLAASVKQEMDTLFHSFLNPLSESLPVDLRFVDYDSTEHGREQARNDLKDVRARIYDLLFFISKRNRGLHHPDNNELLRNIVADLQAQNVWQEGAPPLSSTQLQLRAFPVLVRQVFYEMALLFKTDSQESLTRLYEMQIELVQEQTQLTETQKNQLLAMIRGEFLELLDSFLDQSNRNGRVLLDYNDWPEGSGLSPTLIVVNQTLDDLQNLLLELHQMRRFEITLEK